MSIQLGWDPARTWVFMVGLLEWLHADSFSAFPQLNRRDAALVEIFRRAGVPSGQVVYLQDREATTDRIQQSLVAHLARTSPGDLFILYFCGHGAMTKSGATYFASYDADGTHNTGWTVDSIPAAIDAHFRGARALLMADCCHSGSLANAIESVSDRIGYACLASSLASELSTGNWTFTEGVLAAMGGQAFVDEDANGAITLQELADQLEDNLAFAEEQLATFATRGDFDPHTVLAAARPRPDRLIGSLVEVRWRDKWFPAQIIDLSGMRFKVHYFGYEESDDAWVEASALRQPVRPTYAVGSAVDVRWKSKWYPATILDLRKGVHQIHYDGFGSAWDEWVSTTRIRPRTA